MGCGCNDKKLNNNRQLDNNKRLDNNKILKLDSIQNLSTDEIINLYRDGYILDGLEDSQYNHTSNIQEQNINIQSQYSSIKSLGSNPDIRRVAAYDSYWGGPPYKVAVLFQNGMNGYIRLAVTEEGTSNLLGESKWCWARMPYPFCYIEIITLTSFSNIVDVKAYSCSSGENCSSYTCSIEALNSTNLSNPIMQFDSTTLSAPSITVTPLDSSLRLQWTASTGTDVFAYRVIVYQSGNPVFDGYTEPSNRDVTITELTNGINYSINISGFNNSHQEGDAGLATGIPSAPVVKSISVTSPNGGENWLQNSAHNITWGYQNLTGNVKIELFKGGVLDSTISAGTAISTGTYSWTIPLGQAVGTDYSIKITSISDPSVLDSSNVNFQISATGVSSITVTSPNGGENWLQNSAHNITWDYQNLTGNVKIELFKGGVLNSVLSSSIAIDTGTYSWTISPSQTAGTDYTIKITSLSNPSIMDSSFSNFQISTSSGIICQSISTPTAIPSTISFGESTLLSATVTPSSPTSQEFSVQFMDGNNAIGNPVTTANLVATKTWIPSNGIHNVSAKVGTECESSGTFQVVVSGGATPESGGAGIVVVLAAVAGAAILLSKERIVVG